MNMTSGASAQGQIDAGQNGGTPAGAASIRTLPTCRCGCSGDARRTAADMRGAAIFAAFAYPGDGNLSLHMVCGGQTSYL